MVLVRAWCRSDHAKTTHALFDWLPLIGRAPDLPGSCTVAVAANPQAIQSFHVGYPTGHWDEAEKALRRSTTELVIGGRC